MLIIVSLENPWNCRGNLFNMQLHKIFCPISCYAGIAPPSDTLAWECILKCTVELQDFVVSSSKKNLKKMKMIKIHSPHKENNFLICLVHLDSNMKAITESRILTIQSKSKREEIPQSSELHKWFGEISISLFLDLNLLHKWRKNYS